MFSYCTSLENITIPDSVTCIGEYAFYYCTSLRSVTITNSIKKIYSDAFGNCKNLVSITFTGTKSEWAAIGKYTWWDYKTSSYVIHCTDGDITKTVT